jgi:hypothetical protein
MLLSTCFLAKSATDTASHPHFHPCYSAAGGRSAECLVESIHVASAAMVDAIGQPNFNDAMIETCRSVGSEIRQRRRVRIRVSTAPAVLSRDAVRKSGD